MAKKDEPTLRALIPIISREETLSHGNILHSTPGTTISTLDAFALIWFIRKYEPHDVQLLSATKIVFVTYPTAHSCNMFWHEASGKELRADKNEITLTGDEVAMRPLFQYMSKASDGSQAFDPRTPSLLPSLIFSKLTRGLGEEPGAHDLELLAAYGIDTDTFEHLRRQRWYDIAAVNDYWITDAPDRTFISLLRLFSLA